MWDLARFPHSSITQPTFICALVKKACYSSPSRTSWMTGFSPSLPVHSPLLSLFNANPIWLSNLSVWQAITCGVARSQYLSACSLFARADTFHCHSWCGHSTDADIHEASPLQFTALPTGTSPTRDGSLWEHPHSWVSRCLCPKSQYLPSFQGLGPWLYLSRDPSLVTRCCSVGPTWASAGVRLHEHTFWPSCAGRSLVAAPPLRQPKFDQGLIYF